MSLKYNTAPLTQSQKVVRGLRAASIPGAIADVGLQLVQWTGAYDFGTFGPAAGTPQLGSLFHAGVGSRGVVQPNLTSGGIASYFNQDAGGLQTSTSDETYQTFPNDGGVVQIPMYGANHLAASLFVEDTVGAAASTFKLSLYRVVNFVDNAAWMGNNAASTMPLAHWCFQSQAPGFNSPQLNFSGYRLAAGTSFYLELVNLTSPANLNMMAGDIYLHA